MTNLSKQEPAAPEGRGADDSASLSLLAAAFERLVTVLKLRDQVSRTSLSAEEPVPVAEDEATGTLGGGDAENNLAGSDAETTSTAPQAAVTPDIPTVPVASIPEVGDTETTTTAPRAAIIPSIPVIPMAAIPEVAQTLEPVITPQELEMQLASVESMSGKWFLVTAGLEPGIYSSWAEAAPDVMGVSKSAHLSLTSKARALSKYTKVWVAGAVVRQM